MVDRQTRLPRGFGFIKFKEPEAATLAIKHGPHLIDERTVRAVVDSRGRSRPRSKTGNHAQHLLCAQIECKPSIPLGQQPPGGAARARKVFVGGLSPATTEGGRTTRLHAPRLHAAIARGAGARVTPPRCAPLPADDFRAYFATFGAVAEAQIMIDPNTNRPRGFGCAQRC